MDAKQNPPEPQKTTAPPSQVMDVVAPPPVEDAPPADPDTPKEPQQIVDTAKKKEKVKTPAKPKTPRQPGVGLAIISTVIIVLGLSALATYAFLQTK